MKRLWHQVTDSSAFRLAVKSKAGRRLTGTGAWRSMDMQRNRILMARSVAADPHLFDEVKTFCLFVGHNKSGTSLLGSLLDAHPRVVMSDEVGALRYIEAGFDRRMLFHRLMKGARSEARKGRVTARRLEPYSYAVPGQWQGRVDRPLVVGDGMAGTTTRMLGRQPDLLDRTREVLGPVELKLIQVIRNPYDPISVMMVRGGRTFRNAIDHYFSACRTLTEIRAALPPETLHEVRYEEFIRDPILGLGRLCRFAGVGADRLYTADCVAILRTEPDRSRSMVEWGEPWVAEVRSRMQEFDFLEGYVYEQ